MSTGLPILRVAAPDIAPATATNKRYKLLGTVADPDPHGSGTFACQHKGKSR